jgi:hypothetical protein
MSLRVFLLFLILWSLPLTTFGEALREIELTDGSTIQAEVLSMDGKVYQLRSDVLGTIAVPEDQVKAIRSPGETLVRPQITPEPTPNVAPSSLATTPSANELQQALSQNPATMDKILSLQNDPLMQQILSDENTMRAVQAGDLGALLNDPKVRALMNHPTVRELSDQYGQ